MLIKETLNKSLNTYYDINKFQSDFNTIYKITDKKKIEQIQLLKVNSIWSFITNKFEFYQDYKNKYRLPDTIKSLKDLNKFPTISKLDIQQNYEKIFKDTFSNKYTLTGGSSGESTKFPTGYLNSKNNFNITYFLRNIHSIDFNDPTCYIWGHSHKFGKGILKKNTKKIIKSLKNFFLNRKQFSAYDLSEKNLYLITKFILLKKPKIIFGYGSSLSTLFRYMYEQNKEPFNNNIKIINTSENLDKEILPTIKKLYPNSTLVNEFGMAESGVIGYNEINDFYKIKIFWPGFITQSIDNKLILTTLLVSNFPLFRYLPDDYVNIKNEDNLLNFEIKGKERPIFNFIGKGNTKKISLILLDHVLKYEKFIYSFQYEIMNEILVIKILSKNCDEKYVRKKINNVIGFNPENYKIKFMKNLDKTVAGKLFDV